MSVPRLHLLYEQDIHGEPHGCSHIRLLRPFAHASVKGALQVSVGKELPGGALDAVIVERQWKPGLTLTQASSLVSEVRATHARLIHTLDDNLIDLHDSQPWKSFPSREARTALRYLIREADGVIVSTTPLKERLTRLNPRVRIVLNAIDETLFPPRRYAESRQAPRGRADGVVRVGYMGTLTHTADLMMILQPLREFLRRHAERTAFEIVGVSTEPRLAQSLEGLPVKILDTGAHVAYERFIAWMAKHLSWDFAIAPLDDNLFNRYKSDIKYLDYAMLGIPAIFSDVDAYRGTVRHNDTGWLCENRPESWLAALERFLFDPSLRQALSRNAEDHVRGQRTLEHRAWDWVAAASELMTA